MKALYRRYRPKTLDEVIGQPQITDILKKSLQSGKISHAYLFVGPRGCGKTSVARIFAHEINHFPYELEDEYLDIIEIDAASNTGVDNIRDLREKAIIAPAKGKYKIYIIDEVHMLSKSAFNALLKTLEEPPEHVVFIMATTDAQKVPITITSRSQVHTFKLADPSTMLDHLKKIAKAEKFNIDEEALKIIVRRGGGSFRDSLSLLDQVSTLSDDKIDAQLVNSALGLPQEDIIAALLDAYTDGNIDTIRAHLQNLFDANIRAESIAESLINTILSAPQAVFLPLLDKLVDVSRASFPQVKLLLALAQKAPIAAPQNVSYVPTPKAIIQQPAAPKPTPKAIETPKPAPKAPETPKPTTAQATEEVAKEETTAAESTEKPAPAPNPAPAIVVNHDASDEEIWQQITQHIQEKALPVLEYIHESDYQIVDKTLTIYAKKNFSKRQLDKKKSVILEVLPEGFTVEINDKTLMKDAEIAGIMELMGGGEEVQIDA